MEGKDHKMSGSLVPLTLQWSLNETADGFYKISKDIVRAASTDNIQTTALDALDKFGATLAICSETEYHVEQQLRLTRSSRLIGFLKAHLGFIAGDSCEALSKSTGGIRFLCLAAALVTWDTLDAAKATREMLKDSSRRDQFLPTLGQIKDVHEALEYKMHVLCFAEVVLRWQSRVRDAVMLSPQSYRVLSQPLPQDFIDRQPQPSVLAAIVRALRDTSRLGRGGHIRITVRLGFAWLVAFCEWCTGQPPVVLSLENGQVIQDDPEGKSNIVIALGHHFSESIVEVATRIDGPTQLWKTEYPFGSVLRDWSGMVSMNDYGSKFLWACELDEDLGSRALKQALVYSCKAVLIRLPFFHHQAANTFSTSTIAPRQVDPSFRSFSRRITSTICKYLNVEDREAYKLKELKEGQEIQDLSSVKEYIRDTRDLCKCSHCGDDPSAKRICMVRTFEYYIAHVTAQILASSVLELTEPVKLFWSASCLPQSLPKDSVLIAKVLAILFPNSEVGPSCNIVRTIWEVRKRLRGFEGINLMDIFNFARYLIGHEPDPEVSWVASSHRGQVIFAHFFESRRFDPQSFALIDGGPGGIVHNDEKYRLVQGGDPSSATMGEPSKQLPVDRVRNLLEPPGVKIKWEASNDLLD